MPEDLTLNEQLDEGEEIARRAVRHLIAMGGASTVRQAVEVDGRMYDVTISVEGGYDRSKLPNPEFLFGDGDAKPEDYA